MVGATLALVGSIAACGSSDDSNGGKNGNGDAGSIVQGGPNTPGALVGPGCATSNANGQAEPVHLVFMVDRSGSMKFNPAPNNKWDSVVAGLTGFFNDAQSAGLFAAEQVFPQGDSCNASAYQNMIVPVTALPDKTGALIGALNANGPDPNFNTPTEPALQGAIAFAKTLKASGKKTAVVLVTDGEPQGCSSSAGGSATEAGKGLPDIKTYVIGVGDSLTQLNQIAAGGGTTKAVLISTASPSQITTDFVNALGQIRSQALSCDYGLPPPPNGEVLDVTRVNVQFTPQGGTVQTMEYSENCANGKGWHYDNAASPTKVLICPDSCNTLLANANGKISIVFGCRTVATPH
jgi:hypothetical protein